MGIKTKIDWCDASWNPVTGCFHGCEYCYARKIARRFCTNEHGKDDCGVAYPCTGDCTFCSELDGLEFVGQKIRWNHSPKEPYPFGFFPTFHPHRLDIPARWTRPRTIFVCSMADMFGEWVPESWIQEVFSACEAAPQHTYLFLTKNPHRLTKMCNARLVKEWNAEHPDRPHPATEQYEKITPLPRHDNWWWGSSVTTTKDRFFQGDISDHVFISIEPILEYLDAGLGSFGGAEWIIVGAETGNRKGKVTPRKEWIRNIEEAAGITSAAVFMKDSLKDLMGDDLRQEFPFKKPVVWEGENAFCPTCGARMEEAK